MCRQNEYRIKCVVFLCIILLPLVTVFAQKPAPTIRDSSFERFNGKTITVRYGKPSLNGRKIFGSVVPYYKVWRTGSGAATEFETEADIEINGAIVPRGKYTLYTIPTETNWKFIINKQTGQWGTVYNSQYDLARLDIRPEQLKTPVENLTFSIQKIFDNNGVLVLEWEYVRLRIPFHVSSERLIPSPKDSLRFQMDGVTIAVYYSRPSVRGRKIFGGVVSYGQVWRTGANAATTISFSNDVIIGDTLIPKGTYTIFTLPTKKYWLLIINRQTGQWGTMYNKEYDFVRLPMKVRKLPSLVEQFTIRIDKKTNTSASLKLQWEYTEASVDITLPQQ